MQHPLHRGLDNWRRQVRPSGKGAAAIDWAKLLRRRPYAPFPHPDVSTGARGGVIALESRLPGVQGIALTKAGSRPHLGGNSAISKAIGI